MDSIWSAIEWIMFFFQFDNIELEKARLSTPAAISAIQDHYALQGIPPLNSEDHARLMQTIDDLYCSLSTRPPPDVSPTLLQSFFGSLKAMWLDLGGSPEDLGC